ncbi:hypothetical protein U14_03152 [Candidatus Moduliflexus flocculans]|uniref:Uncharacterized protein n=1 Tax=Candidatus Moduliflexus flocculans TaxID=1499966 RepID=A0A081BNE0_9BACT|nr:hypothetical protein U14_03152 [Candidatus Moduliflexus flocculans]
MNVLFLRSEKNGSITSMFRLPRSSRPRESLVILMLLLAALLTIFPNASAEKLRAAFGGICPADEGERRLALLKQHGFNAALVNDSGLDVKTALWKEWARLAHQYDILLFPILSFAGTAEIGEWRGSFTPYTTPDGTRLNRTSCPLDAEYWEKSVAQRWETLALLSKQVPFAGIVIDTEMYGSDIVVYEQPCLCDLCWQEFLLAISAADPAQFGLFGASPIPAAQRKQFLEEHQLWPQYLNIQEQRLQAIAAQIERRIHGINPALTLGIMAYVDSWFYRGLIRGLGTSAQPVNVFSETFYIRGWSSDVLAEQATIKQDSVATYLPGLWQGRFFSDDLPAQASELAHQADGYWFFTADSLWTDNPKTGHYALHGIPADYWAAWDKANTMIREQRREPFFPSSVYQPDIQRLQTPPRLKRLLHDLAAHPTSSPEDAARIVYAEQTLFHFLPTPDGVIRIIPDESPGQQAVSITYHLFDEAGTLAQTGDCTKLAEIAIPSHASGMMSLLISPEKPEFRIEFDSIPWVVEASVTFPLATRTSPLVMRFAVAPEQEKLRFKMTSYTAKPPLVTYVPPDGIERAGGEFHEYGEMCAPIADMTKEGGFWTLKIVAPSEETTRWHYFYQTPLPYVMLNMK